MVVWLYSCMVVRFSDLLVSWFRKYKISCFQEDIDFISMIFKILFNGSSSFVGAGLFFPKLINMASPKFWDLYTCFEIVPICFSYF